jgi:CHASE2 domain-containing sensor protein
MMKNSPHDGSEAHPPSGGAPKPGRRLSAVSRRMLLATLVGALLAGGVVWPLLEWGWGRGWQHASYDLLHVKRGDRRVREAAIVYLDDISFEKLEQPRNVPWDRALHARLVERLTQAGAKAIVFDVCRLLKRSRK